MAPVSSRWAGPLTAGPPSPVLDPGPWVGQREISYRFDLIDGVSGELLEPVTPLASSPPQLSHDPSRTIPRSLSMALGVADTARVDPLRHRVLPVLVDDRGSEWPLGRYMWADRTVMRRQGGAMASPQLVDEMFVVDQELPQGFTAGWQADQVVTDVAGVEATIHALLAGLPIRWRIEPSPGFSVGSWTAGTSRAAVLNDLALDGNYLRPWMSNRGVLRLRRVFDPAAATPDLDWDASSTVFGDSVVTSDDLLTVPSRIVVVGSGGPDSAGPMVGVWTAPSSAPFSAARRGFEVPRVVEMQVASAQQAQLAAETLGFRLSVPAERMELDTAPDPRHDSHQVIRYDGRLWLELAWQLTMTPGGRMHHVLGRVWQ